MNHLRNSKIWIKYLENHFDECKDYFKFAMVWMSFNSYYASRYNHIRGELNQIIEFAKDNKNLYLDLKGNELNDVLAEFKNTGWLFDVSGDRSHVKNMCRNSNQEIYFQESNQSCEDFFRVMYQIRCNFFHGSKEISDNGNKKLIKWAHKYLNIFWKKVLDRSSNGE